jgi:hypothetical protein
MGAGADGEVEERWVVEVVICQRVAAWPRFPGRIIC